MVTAYIALGSNISKREDFLKDAVRMLTEHESIANVHTSTIYETKPVGYTEQNDFLNMVVKVDTSLSAFALLDLCQGIEQELGRKRVVKWGPRTIDLDILLYNQENIKSEHLMIPHPSMHERAFVMVPLVDLSREVYIPTIGLTAQEALSLLAQEEVEEVRVWGELDLS
ncbi:2-amino-4-hydroxy-6-hydroxymethyldihydropteridine diphosphokinase [Halobacillus salinarum]